ncbi:SusD family protein [Myroides marinus]|uniref:Starch-binding protein n=1 Tax=Myroides marinus TaxID=703342 RepID=A0A164A7R1_9FLAO|nr:RagB/SusD family nutrient uptake outer membrane protein [Myroides marinus]KZE83108.1 starch-binding protein [Myroides marinus]SEI50670.1 SusD family protein [Myroides marinus]
MKRRFIKYILGAVLMSGTLVSCDLDTSPTTALEDAKVFKTTAGSEKVWNGTWVYLMETFNSYANPGYGSFLRASDAMGNDAVLNGNYGFINHYRFSAIYGKGGTNSLSWIMTYKVIDNMNNIITRIDGSEGPVADKKRIKGQALALRGFMYLHLASSYSFAIDLDPEAKTAPIYLTPSTATTTPNPLATVRELYNQSIKDLEEAYNLIPNLDSYKRGSDKFRIDQQVVLGLLSRVHLYARNWEQAKKYSDLALANNDRLMSESDYKAGFNDASNVEWIWGHLQTPEQSGASYQFHYLDTTSPDSYYYSFNADPYFKDLFDDGDYRKSMIYWAPNPSNVAPKEKDAAYMRYAKFKFKAGQIADIVLMRTSEIYLINAEAKAQLGDGDAINKLNQLKTARGAKVVSGLAGKDLLEAIYVERRKELFGEGFALVDIVRNQKAVERKAIPTGMTVPFTYETIDNAGVVKNVTVNLVANGHNVLNFPDKTAFVPNSKYYLYRITDSEINENPHL